MRWNYEAHVTIIVSFYLISSPAHMKRAFNEVKSEKCILQF